jgi:hypothetical protein
MKEQFGRLAYFAALAAATLLGTMYAAMSGNWWLAVVIDGVLAMTGIAGLVALYLQRRAYDERRNVR